MSEPASEPSPPAPRWLVHADGRVTEFDPSQLAAGLYRARCSHERAGAAVFAAELSAAVMHFAAHEFNSPVWRSERLKQLAAKVLAEFGHSATADAWLRQGEQPPASEAALAYSPDLVGLVEEGVLDFDLRLEDAKPVLKVVDALEFAGLARSGEEFLEGLRPVLADAAADAERVLVHGVCQGAALLHRAGESPEDAAAEAVELVAETIAATLTPMALDLRWKPAQGGERLSGGPLFPFDPPADAVEFHRRLVDAIPRHVAALGRSPAPLCVVTTTNREATVKSWLADWRARGADRAASVVIGFTRDLIATPRAAEVAFRFLPESKRMAPGTQEVGILAAVVRAAAQRVAALRRNGALLAADDATVAACLPGFHYKIVRDLCRRRLKEFARPHGMVVRLTAPCRVWWGDGVGDFSIGSQSKRAPDLWWLPPADPSAVGCFLLPRRESR